MSNDIFGSAFGLLDGLLGTASQTATQNPELVALGLGAATGNPAVFAGAAAIANKPTQQQQPVVTVSSGMDSLPDWALPAAGLGMAAMFGLILFSGKRK